MAGKPLRLIVVGKLKHHFILEGCELYLKRIRHWRTPNVVTVRDGDPSFPLEKRLKQEGEQILGALSPNDEAIVLDERGKSMSSVALANLLGTYDTLGKSPCFIIGGPYGLDESVRARANRLLSLSAMTLPHELARLMLCEQLYRAECIRRNVPYHHA
ncbi:MAG: 23S rRNA (pseudouridine(1915)-N(3))-methyltransferase RlmH [Desulfovibrio sp.]|nr:23S rRNA (pseudouridine(1915)-N(3))-methyltransferase RlmH [Desulfovibrio sp.]